MCVNRLAGLGKLGLCTKDRWHLREWCRCYNSFRMLKKAVSEAAGESKPEAYPQGYVEDFDEPRTTLADFFSILVGQEKMKRKDHL